MSDKVSYNRIEMAEHDAIEITSGKFNGVIFSFEWVKFISNVCKFHYNIHTHDILMGIKYREDELVKVMGDILVELIEDGLGNNKIVYRGGIGGVYED